MPRYEDDDNIITIGRPEIKDKIKKPSMYTVAFFNDDYTEMTFVVHVMTNVCNLSLEEATVAMLKVHKEGKANVGSYTFEIAEDKCYRIINLAIQQGYPLMTQPEELK